MWVGRLTNNVMLSEVEASPRHGRLYVILSETKDLLAGHTLSTVIARLGTSRGNLLAGYVLSTRVVAGRL